MIPLRFIAIWRLHLPALCCAATLGAPLRAAASPLDDAMTLYERNQWPAAFAALARLADRGDAEAARIATMMWRHGRPLYGIDFRVETDRVDHWRSLAGIAPAPTGLAARR